MMPELLLLPLLPPLPLLLPLLPPLLPPLLLPLLPPLPLLPHPQLYQKLLKFQYMSNHLSLLPLL